MYFIQIVRPFFWYWFGLANGGCLLHLCIWARLWCILYSIFEIEDNISRIKRSRDTTVPIWPLKCWRMIGCATLQLPLSDYSATWFDMTIYLHLECETMVLYHHTDAYHYNKGLLRFQGERKYIRTGRFNAAELYSPSGLKIIYQKRTSCFYL